MGRHKGGKGGTIVNMSSIIGLQGNPLAPIYAGTNFAVVGFTSSLLVNCDFAKQTMDAILCPSSKSIYLVFYRKLFVLFYAGCLGVKFIMSFFIDIFCIFLDVLRENRSTSIDNMSWSYNHWHGLEVHVKQGLRDGPPRRRDRCQGDDDDGKSIVGCKYRFIHSYNRNYFYTK